MPNWMNETDWLAATKDLKVALCDGPKTGQRGQMLLTHGGATQHMCGNLATGVFTFATKREGRVVSAQYHPRCDDCAPERTAHARAKEVWEQAERLAGLRKGD